MTPSKVRYDFVDNAKGLALLIVISWHCYAGLFPHTVFSQWVLPFFFIVMGFFYRHNLGLKQLAVKKANGLLVPWVIFAAPAVVLGLFGVKGFDIHKVYNPYYMILGPSWFLISMFWSYLIYWCLNSLTLRRFGKRQRECLLLLCAVVFGLSWSMNYINIAGHRAVFPFFLSSALTCTVFVGIGAYFKGLFLETPLISMKNGVMLLSCISVCFISVCFGGGKAFNPLWNQTNQPVLLVIPCSVAGSYVALQFCRILPKAFKWIGENTIPVLCIHYYPTLILSNYYPDINPWLKYMIVLITTLPLTYLVCKYLPAANGKVEIFKIIKR